MSEFRDQAREVLGRYVALYGDMEREVLDALEAIVPQTIDRDALIADLLTFPWAMSAEAAADRLISRVLRPDPRIAKLEALIRDDRMFEYMGQEVMYVDQVRAILRGES